MKKIYLIAWSAEGQGRNKKYSYKFSQIPQNTSNTLKHLFGFPREVEWDGVPITWSEAMLVKIQEVLDQQAIIFIAENLSDEIKRLFKEWDSLRAVCYAENTTKFVRVGIANTKYDIQAKRLYIVHVNPAGAEKKDTQ